MSEYEVKVFDTPPENLEEKVAKLKAFAFKRSEDPKEEELHNDKYCSGKDTFKILLALKENEPIGHVKLLKRTLLYKGSTILLGGFGAVCTDERYRRQGIATTLLKKGLEILKENNCDIAYLCTDIYNQGMIALYGQLGFVLLNKPHTYLGRSGKRYTDTDGMIAPICSQELFKEVLQDKESFDIGRGNW